MNTFKYAKWTLAIWFLFSFITNSYFGWESTPITQIEVLCSLIRQFMLGMFISFYFIIPLTDIYEQWVNNKLNK